MIVGKWNFKTRKYDKIEVDNDFKVYYRNLDTVIKCINCKKPLRYGDSYSSLMYHDGIGLAYPVCSECYDEEWKLRRKYEKE